MSLFRKIELDLHDSLKNGDGLRLSVLHMLESKIKHEKNKTGKDFPWDKILNAVSHKAKIEIISQMNPADLSY